MAKKHDMRGKIPRMKDLSIAEEDELIQRWRLRNALRMAYPEVVGAMLQWVLDSPDIEAFVAGGHETHFTLIPRDDLLERMVANGFTEAEFQEAMKHNEGPASWMTFEELQSVLERIKAMLAYFQNHEPSTFAHALSVYQFWGRSRVSSSSNNMAIRPSSHPFRVLK